MRKFWVGLVAVVLLSLMLVPSAMALDMRTGSSLVVEKTQTIDDDLVYTGTSLVIDGTVHGDVFAFGESVTVNGTIDGDLVAFGSRVDVLGTVTGSVFSAANDVFTRGRVDGSVVAAGSTVTIDQQASVAHSLIMAGNNLRADGAVGRGALVAGNLIEIGGQVGRELQAWGSSLNIGGGASVAGPVTFHGNQPATVDPGAHTGKVTFFQNKEHGNFGVRSMPLVTPFWRTALKFAGFILVGLLLFSLFPGLRSSFPQAIREKPWQTPVAGFIALVAVPVALVLLLVTVVGIPLALVSFFLLPVVMYVGQVLLSWTVARLTADRLEALQNLSWPVLFLLGALVTTILVQLPFVGGLFGFFAVLYGIGGIYFTLIEHRRSA